MQRAWRSVALVFLVPFGVASCVVLDLFPSADDGAGGAGAGGSGSSFAATDGSASSTVDGSAVSASSSSGVTGVTVDWVEGLNTGTPAIASARFLDLTLTPDAVVAAGYVIAEADYDLDFGTGCVQTMSATTSFFAAGFDPDLGHCLWLQLLPDQSAVAAAPHASVALYDDRVHVAISDRANMATTIHRFTPGNANEEALAETFGLVIADIVGTPSGLAIGGYVTDGVGDCGWFEANAGETDAFFARLTGPGCGMIARVDLGHDPLEGNEEVVSVAFENGADTITVVTDHTLTAGMMSVPGAGKSGSTFFQDLASHDVYASGDVTCADMSVRAPPRVAMAAGRRWVFGPNCDPHLMFLRGGARETWELMESFPQPDFFDRPVAAAATDRLVFGGEYRGGEMPWVAQWTTGVIGSFDPNGDLRYRLDVRGEDADHDTEVTGVATTATGETIWAIGNYATDGFTLGDFTYQATTGYSCSPGVPCKPFITRLTVANP